VDLSVYFHIIARQKWVILVTTLVVIGVVAWGSSQTEPTYQAATRLRIVPYSLGAPDYGSYIYFDRLANTYFDIVNSDTVTDQAKAELGIEKLPNFSIEVIPQTELMRLVVTDTNPELAQSVANTLARILLEQNEASYSDGVQSRLSERIASLESQIDTLTVQYTELSNQIPRDNARLTEVQRTLDALEQNYNLLLTNSNQAVIAEIARASALSMVETAKVPTEPIGPNRVRDIALATMLGVAAGLGLAFLLESFNPRLYSDQQLESTTKAPVIARIPSIKRAFRNDVFAGDRIASEAFRRLRTHFFAQISETPLRFLLVTSSIPGEGKTTVSTNLALSIAQSGRSVLLIDGNMQGPVLHNRYQLSNLAGLSSVLSGKAKLSDCVQWSNKTMLYVLCAGPANDTSSELLSSDQFYKLLDEAVQTYEVVIFDGPPILASADSLIIAKQTSGVLWVIDRSKIDQNTLAYTREQLDQVGAHVIGTIANRVSNDKNTQWGRRYKPFRTDNSVTIKSPENRSSATTEGVKL
jgi:non-specific protein-tyrosine kinase